MSTPQPPEDLRNCRVVIYMTEEDAAYLARLSRDLGFRSRSTLIVSVLERLIMGGFALVAWFKVGHQFSRLLDRKISDQMEFTFDAFRAAVRPLPALPVEDDPDRKEVREGLAEIREELLTNPKK